MMTDNIPKIEVTLTQVIRRVEVTVVEGGGGTHLVRLGGHAASVPWSALAGVPSNLCTAALSGDALSIEFFDLQGKLITKAPYLT